MNNVPHIGQTVTVYGKTATIIRVYHFGTVDVETEDGNYYRITGIGFIN